MATPGAAPIEALEEVRTSEARLLTTITPLDDDAMARP